MRIRIQANGEVAVVHNGIIENFESLRERLRQQGYQFVTQTDSEVIAHLIHAHYEGDLLKAVRRTVAEFKGAYAIAAISTREPGRIIGARAGSPLLVGIGEHDHFLASDASALAPVTQRVAYLEEGDLADIRRESYAIYDNGGAAVERKIVAVPASSAAVELGPYRHFMQKEIFEQPRAISDTLESVGGIGPELFGEQAAAVFANVEPVHPRVRHELLLGLVAGAIVARERRRYSRAGRNCQRISLSRQRAERRCADCRDLAIGRDGGYARGAEACAATGAPPHAGDLQRGDEFDGAADNPGLSHARGYRSRRCVDQGVYHAIGGAVPADADAGQTPRPADTAAETHWLAGLRHLPVAIQSVLALEPSIIAWAEQFARKQNALFLGRGLHYPVALEGALKLKEISYIHAEAYPAGELKHGPLALVDSSMPVVAIAPNDALIEKLKSNLQEVRARGGELYVVADADSHIESSEGIHVLRLPEHAGLLSPIVHTIPLQLLAYHTAVICGTDVDKPRNLAKSVTVE